MLTARELITAAFEKLSERPGYVERHDQQQLALLISDCIEDAKTGLFEAPTGLGKSLAGLLAAIAHALVSGKRTVIATYTNVLAEQYWRQDLLLALSLFEGDPPKCDFLIGRQRYACLVAMAENAPETLAPMSKAALGIESEFRSLVNKRPRDLSMLWQQVSAPPVCPGRLCPQYDKCFYYKARRSAERAQVLITNHSVVMQDALLRRGSEGATSLIGDYDFLLVDEAHDFPQAAIGALEFELSEPRLGILSAVANKLEQSVLPLAAEAGRAREWMEACEGFRVSLAKCQTELKAYGLALARPGILSAAPSEVWDHPQVRAIAAKDALQQAEYLAADVSKQIRQFKETIEKLLSGWGEEGKEIADEAKDTIRSYQMYIAEFGWGCDSLFQPTGVSVSYASRGAWATEQSGTKLRYDTIALAEPLRELVWEERPWACMSATLALDGEFEFYKRVTGAEPEFEEVLPTSFDYPTQAALYMPAAETIPDPSRARKGGFEEAYYDALAIEIGAIIQAAGGRTLALFHSRREMEGVRERLSLSDEFPVYQQGKTGTATIGDKFRQNTRASLFALRSFWTGFDAPGETLSCVILVRVPFEVPIDPPQVARQAWLQSQGLDPFEGHTLPMAKMLMRQGAGRLIRRSQDKGVIAILDPRIRSKRYGEQILRNLPEGIRSFEKIDEAFAWLGISDEATAVS